MLRKCGICCLALVALAVAPAVCGAQLQHRAAQSRRGFSPTTTRALKAIVTTAMAASNTPGMEVGVWVPGRGSFVHAFGTSDIRTGKALALDDHFRIASISKTFTATAALQLVDRGRLKLSDRLSSFVSGIPYGKRITVEQLLDMTAGVYDYSANAGFERDYLKRPNFRFGTRQVLSIIRRNRPAFAPGTQVMYDNSNYYLLGLIVEKVTHQSLARVIRNRILRPLRLRHTSYPSGSRLPKPFARGYLPNQSGQLRDVTVSNPAAGGPAGAMISTLADLKVWARALATGTLLEPATQAARLRTRVLSQTPSGAIRYGLGITEINGFLGHNGSILGYGSAMFYLPSRRATIIVLNDNNSLTTAIPTNVFIGIASYLFPSRFPG